MELPAVLAFDVSEYRAVAPSEEGVPRDDADIGIQAHHTLQNASQEASTRPSQHTIPDSQNFSESLTSDEPNSLGRFGNISLDLLGTAPKSSFRGTAEPQHEASLRSEEISKEPHTFGVGNLAEDPPCSGVLERLDAPVSTTTTVVDIPSHQPDNLQESIQTGLQGLGEHSGGISDAPAVLYTGSSVSSFPKVTAAEKPSSSADSRRFLTQPEFHIDIPLYSSESATGSEPQSGQYSHLGDTRPAEEAATYERLARGDLYSAQVVQPLSSYPEEIRSLTQAASDIYNDENLVIPETVQKPRPVENS